MLHASIYDEFVARLRRAYDAVTVRIIVFSYPLAMNSFTTFARNRIVRAAARIGSAKVGDPLAGALCGPLHSPQAVRFAPCCDFAGVHRVFG